LPEQFRPLKADIVIANILAQPLCELSESIAALLKPSAQLVLSGILKEQAESVITAYNQHSIQIQAPTIQEDWCRLNGIK
jgi:ribosomal protein L11 methyltransferase